MVQSQILREGWIYWIHQSLLQNQIGNQMNILLNTPVTITDRYYIAVTKNEQTVLDNQSGTYFVLSKESKLDTETMCTSGCYAAMIDGTGTVTGDAVVIFVAGVKRVNNSVTQIDPTSPGDLSYIDSCSNSILVGPNRNGDPCLNYLYFPRGVDQTFHTHPSIRIGMIISGSGTAEWVSEDTNGVAKLTALNAGDFFVLERHVKHRFKTDQNSTMSIAVFHPDSADGPLDEYNPMKTRTYLK